MSSDHFALTGGESGTTTYSERVAEAIDAEVRMLIDAAAQQAEHILMRQREVLDALAARLLDAETIEGDELEQIFQGEANADDDAIVTPLSTHRYRPSTGPGLLALPPAAIGLASTTLPDDSDELSLALNRSIPR